MTDRASTPPHPVCPGPRGTRRVLTGTFTAIALVTAAAAPVKLAARAQPAAPASPSSPQPLAAPRTQTPWAVGEFLEYSLRFGALSVGSGRMQVLARDTLRGRGAWRIKFDFSGGIPFAHVNDVFESWLDVETHNSLRFEQHLLELGKRRDRVYEIFPERATFSLNGQAEEPSVPDPLDDAAFFFFVRTIPLEVGRSYDFYRYFNPKANPVTIRVLRRDTVDVPAGRFPAIVIQPMIKTNGIFSEGGHAELWLSDDDRRILLQMKSKLVFGSLNLYLRKYVLPPVAPGDPTRRGGV